ncbi:unnamed protein product [Parnassius mnemosyne]|uniref:Reverse transcriptase domain-containing protein n=1 Tax=Parnassius mnemosyne TaxID=213953 RepID=A0AAV1LP01_9NEOP
MIEGIVKDDVIEPSSSPWCSPVVLVKKKDGSMHFCVDYRRLSDDTKEDSYPLPRIGNTLDMLTGKGLWQFKVMPFGLCNAPATFERLMELLLTGLIGDACLVYLDDIIIVGRTFEEHLQNLERVLMKIQSANLKLSPKKCSLFKRQVSFLGQEGKKVVSMRMLRTDQLSNEWKDSLQHAQQEHSADSGMELGQWSLAQVERRLSDEFDHEKILDPMAQLADSG